MQNPFSFEANAVLLGLFRQMVRSRLVIVLLNLYLVALVGLLFGLMPKTGFLLDVIVVQFGVSNPGSSNLLVLLAFFLCYIFTSGTLVVFGSIRTAGERLGEHPMLTTTLQPRRIVRGKILFGVIFSLFFLSLTLPFLSVAYLMRGVDIRLIPFGAASCFGFTMLHYISVLPFYSGVSSRVQAALFTLPLLVLQGVLFWLGTTSFMYGVYDSAVRMNFGLFVSSFGFIFFVLLFPSYFVTLANYAPPSSNRMFPLRVAVAGLGVILLVAYFMTQLLLSYSLLDETVAEYFRSFRFVFWWTVPFLFLTVICEEDRWSWRVRQTIPRSFLGRLLAFPFYSGLPGALIWAFLVVLGELAASGIGFLFQEEAGFIFGSKDLKPRIGQLLAGFSATLLLWDYCVMTVLFYHFFLRNRISRRWNWLPLFGITGGLLGVMIAMTILSEFFSINVPFLEHSDFWIVMPFPFWQDDFGPVMTQLAGAGPLAGLLVLTGLPWLRRRFKDFRREK